jgi:PKD repeat protein
VTDCVFDDNHADEEGGGMDNRKNNNPIGSFAMPSCSALNCGFTDTSNDFDGSVVTWLWDFGDGATSTLQNPNHFYAVEGASSVTLTVTDEDGGSDVANHTMAVGVAAEPLTVSTISPSSVQMPTSFLATITGTGFRTDAQVGLSNGKDPTPELSDISVVDSTTITVWVTVKSGGPGRARVWDVTVTSGGLSATLPSGLTVLP